MHPIFSFKASRHVASIATCFLNSANSSLRKKGEANRCTWRNNATQFKSRSSDAVCPRGDGWRKEIRFGARNSHFFPRRNIDRARSHIGVPIVLILGMSENEAESRTGGRVDEYGIWINVNVRPGLRYLRHSLDSDPVRCPRISGIGKWQQVAGRPRGREHVYLALSYGTCGRAIPLQNYMSSFREGVISRFWGSMTENVDRR